MKLALQQQLWCPTDWLSGSGGIGETHIILASFLEKRAWFRTAEPLSAGAGSRLLL